MDQYATPTYGGNASRAMSFYKSKGMSPEDAAAMVWNFQQESGKNLNSSTIHDGGIGVGLAGWNGNRRQALQRLAQSRGVPETDFDTQLEHSWNELNGPEGGAFKNMQAAEGVGPKAAAAIGYFRPRADYAANRASRAGSAAELLSDNPMSQAMAYAPQGNSPMEVIPAQRRAPGAYRPSRGYDEDGSLSSKFIAGGPGALFGAPNGVMQNADGTPGYDIGSSLVGAGAALAGISSPAQGAALTAQLASMQPKAGRYSTKVDRERGVIGLTDAQTGAYSEVPLPGHDPNYKQNDAFQADQGKKFSDLNSSIPAAAIEAKQHLATLGQLEPILANDKVYQGAGGEQWQQAKKLANATGLFNFEGTAEGDAAKSLIAGLTLQSRNMQGGMPGSLSDKDLAFLKTMPPSLDNTKEANQWIVGNMKALHQRTIDYNNWRQEYADAHGGRLDNNFYKFAQQKADQNPIFKEGNVAPAGKAGVDRKPLSDIFK